MSLPKLLVKAIGLSNCYLKINPNEHNEGALDRAKGWLENALPGKDLPLNKILLTGTEKGIIA